MLSLFLMFSGFVYCIYIFWNTPIEMDGNYLRNFLGSAVLGAIWGARNKEQGSCVSVPIPTRELSVPQVQDLSTISKQQEHQGAFSTSRQISAVEHRFSSVLKGLSSTPREGFSPPEPTLMDLDLSSLEDPLALYAARGAFDIPTVHDLIYMPRLSLLMIIYNFGSNSSMVNAVAICCSI